MALHKPFARERIALTIVSDNGIHLTTESLQSWLRSVGCNPVKIAPRHTQSNGQVENFVRTLKMTILTAFLKIKAELYSCIDTFLLQYRNSIHSAIGKALATLFNEKLGHH